MSYGDKKCGEYDPSILLYIYPIKKIIWAEIPHTYLNVLFKYLLVVWNGLAYGRPNSFYRLSPEWSTFTVKDLIITLKCNTRVEVLAP